MKQVSVILDSTAHNMTPLRKLAP